MSCGSATSDSRTAQRERHSQNTNSSCASDLVHCLPGIPIEANVATAEASRNKVLGNHFSPKTGSRRTGGVLSSATIKISTAWLLH
jgi:hypothetical protein